jgi:hypothetical protein
MGVKSRYVVAYEGKPTIDKRVIEPGALTMPDHRVPVVRSFNYEDVIGYAEEFERNEETGEISVEVDLRPGVKVDGLSVTVFANDIQMERKDDQVLIHRGVIRDICFFEGPTAWS